MATPIRAVAAVLLVLAFARADAFSIITTSQNHAVREKLDGNGNVVHDATSRVRYGVTAGDDADCISFAETTVAQPGNTDRNTVQARLLDALGTWNAVSGSLWTWYTASLADGDNADKNCLDDVHDIYWYEEEGVTLAVTWLPLSSLYLNHDSGDPLTPDIGFNTDHTWSFSGTPGAGEFDFETVALHELGHVLGLDHSDESGATMWPTVSSGPASQDTSLATDDMQGLRYLYGSDLQDVVVTGMPASMDAGQPYDIVFTARLSGGSVAPSTVELYLTVSVVGNADVSIQGADAQWTDVYVVDPGDPLTTLTHGNTSAQNPGVEGYETNPSVDHDYDITVRVTPLSGPNVQVRWRAHYVDFAENDLANGGFDDWYAIGDLRPRFFESGVVTDQQGFPARRAVVPVEGSVATSGLVHYPIVPCRLADTRQPGAGGALGGGGETRDLFALGTGPGTGGQGGAPGGCGIPEEAQAVHMVFSAVQPVGAGWLRAWAWGGGEPMATMLNFSGENVSNAVPIRVCPGLCQHDFTVKNYGTGTHLVIDALGYYAPLESDGR